MNNHKHQAQQLCKALLKRDQTWSRHQTVLDEWAEQFQELESDIGSRKRIQRLLDWYCDHGCGALFVPMIGDAQGFRIKFEQLDAAPKRLKGQQLQYFDDILDYNIQERCSGSKAQKDCNRVFQRVRQQIEYVDALAKGRVKLPKARKAKPLSKRKRIVLGRVVAIDRERLWEMIWQSPAVQQEFTRRLMYESPKLHKFIEKVNAELN